MPAVSFNNIPNDIRVPLFYAEIDNSQAGGGGAALRRLLIGQMSDDATGQPGVLFLATRESDAVAIAGEGSMLAAMYSKFRLGDPAGEVWCLPIKLAAGTAASGKFAVTGTATEAGLLSAYVAGRRVRVTVAVGMTAAQAATALAAAINAVANMPVDAVAAAGEVTLTCKWKGAAGNDIQLEMNRAGLVNGERTPAGLAVTVTAVAGGAGSPDMADVLAAVGDEEFEFVCHPYTDTASLDDYAAWMSDISGRWAWSSQLYGHCYSALRGAVGALVAAGQARNDPHMTIVGFEAGVAAPVWEFAAAFAARQAVFISADVARPTQTGQLLGIDAAPAGQRFTLTERQSLLSNGIATTMAPDGVVRIERAVTTYQRNAYGQRDDSYLDSETLHTTAHVVRFLRQRITSKYGRHKLANDGTRFGAGQAIVTPSVIRAELIAAYAALEYQGIVENAELFAQYLVVGRNATNPNRVDVLFPPDYVNQLRIFALLNQFRLQYPEQAA
ncbi:phage tail sheath subtilisin-like domain-containing protein [Cupriavidus oxalaticus]|uniref:Phage tail protein n=1 Tax=Cupriavidus oxalaticus TaxID=96344 RepID=A0A4P7LUK8_9BURK|nr:phage tail sheath subtilisin-like domain-containing protein [Cupriavidus oxalaticus]QBY56151.1 phage tail protein [Cupriavidus oxalaticus]